MRAVGPSPSTALPDAVTRVARSCDRGVWQEFLKVFAAHAAQERLVVVNFNGEAPDLYRKQGQARVTDKLLETFQRAREDL